MASGYSAERPGLDAGLFGVDAERPHEDVYNSDILATASQYSGNYSIEATVIVRETSGSNATAGLFVQRDGSDEKYLFFGIYPDEDKWRLYGPDFDEPLEGAYIIGGAPQSCNLKVSVTGSLITAFIEGQAVASSSILPVAGSAGLRIRETDAQFSDVKVNGIPQELAGWNPSHSIAWSEIVNNSVRGNVLLDPGLLASPELSPKLDARFERMDAMGARYVRFQLSWAEAQPGSVSQPYSWRYADAFAIAAHRNNLEIVPVVVFAPRWAVKPEFRGKSYYQAYPPVDDNGYFDTTGFAQFTGAAAARYKPGGQLADMMGWSADSYGQAGYFEVGPEFNLGSLYENRDGAWVTVGAGWLGSLAQYVDLLKAGHDAVKSSCPGCMVLNGPAADDTITNYYIGDNPGRYDGYVPILDGLRLNNPDGTPAWRQTVWQGIDDLYDEIERRPSPDNVPSRYFDVLNVHTFMWKGYTAEWQYTADRFVSCSFYSDECWKQWYDKRFQEVIRVMNEHNDNRDIWLTETGFASARPGNDFIGFLGFLSEAKQAQALQSAYSSAAAFPQVKKVFWWQAYDSYYTGNLGLIREDLSAKPSYDKYGWLTGKQLDFRSEYVFSWYDNLSASNWVLMANPATASADAIFEVSIAGQSKDLPALAGLSPGQVPPGGVLYTRYPNLIAGPVNVVSNGRSGALASQRTLWAGNSLEEVTGTEAAKLSNHFFWPWYDEKTSGYLNWVLVSNPAATPAFYRIRVGGVDAASGSIAGGGIVTPHFPGVMGGPVEVMAWSDSVDGGVPAEVMASQRVLSNGNKAFNEVPGIPAAELRNDYLWTWYDMRSVGASSWVLIANPPGAAPIYYEVNIGGATVKNDGPILAGRSDISFFPGAMDGPVEVRTFSDPGHTIAANSIASQRVTWGPSFEEVPGYPHSALSNTYHWNWYDQSQANVFNWVVVSKQDFAAPNVYYKVLVAGLERKACTQIPAEGTDAPVFPTVIGGPVEIRSYSDSGCTVPSAPGNGIMASQRVLWNGYFNEVLGTEIS